MRPARARTSSICSRNTVHASLTPEGNTGDALDMAEDVNAAIEDSFSMPRRGCRSR